MPIVTAQSDSVRSRAIPGYPSWQAAVKDAVRSAAELCQMLELPPPDEVAALEAAGGFPLFAPRSYIARMRKGDAHDPLLRQVLPLAAELDSPAGFSLDPVGDRQATIQPGLLHKYAGRVLMVTNRPSSIIS